MMAVDQNQDAVYSARNYPRKRPMVWLAIGFILCILFCDFTGTLGRIGEEKQEQALQDASQRFISANAIVVESKKGLSYCWVKFVEGDQVYVMLPYDDDSWYPMGAKVLISGVLYRPEGQKNPGGFDQAAWLSSKKTWLVMQADSIQLIDTPHGMWALVYQMQTQLDKTLNAYLPQETIGLAKALLLGAKHELSDDFYLVAQQMGIAHVFAVSGLHVGVIGSVILFLFAQCGWARSWFGFLLLAVILTIYTMLAGLPASAIRASLMILLAGLAFRFYRPPDPISFLSLAAVVLLLDNPYLLWNAGFQLSFGVTLSLLLFVQPISKHLSMIPFGWLRNSVAVVLAAWLGSVPISAWHFYTTSIITPLCNMILVPLVSIVVPLLLGAVILSWLFPFGAILWFLPSSCLLWLLHHGTLLLYATWFQLVGPVQWNIGKPTYLVMLLYGIVLVITWLLLQEKAKPHAGLMQRLLVLLLLGICIYSIPRAPEYDQLLYLDAGQGSCAVLRTTAGEVVVFDTGAQKQELSSVLAWYGINTVDAVIISHGDLDHSNGLGKMLQSTQVKQLYFARNQLERESLSDLIALANSRNTKCYFIEQDYRIQLKNNQIVLAVFDDETAGSNQTQLTAVLYDDAGIIAFPGDLSRTGVQRFVAKQQQLTIWTVPHHGSKYAGSAAIYQMLKEKGVGMAIISAGKDNRYGHPHQELILWLDQQQIPWAITYMHGAIQIRL